MYSGSGDVQYLAREDKVPSKSKMTPSLVQLSTKGPINNFINELMHFLLLFNLKLRGKCKFFLFLEVF